MNNPYFTERQLARLADDERRMLEAVRSVDDLWLADCKAVSDEAKALLHRAIITESHREEGRYGYV